MATGKEMKEIYNAMTEICIEVSNLINNVNDQLNAKGFIPLGGKKIMYERSVRWDQPKFWMPYFQQKIWIKEGVSKKGIGINILFDFEDYSNLYPVVSCGYLENSKTNLSGKNNDFFNNGWVAGSKVRLEETSKVYRYANEEETEVIYSYFIPLDLLQNDLKVNEYIVNPLTLLYESNGNIDSLKEVQNLIGEAMRTTQEIIDDKIYKTENYFDVIKRNNSSKQ